MVCSCAVTSAKLLGRLYWRIKENGYVRLVNLFASNRAIVKMLITDYFSTHGCLFGFLILRRGCL